MMEKTKPEISVIVPVYNVEPYLRTCVDSILNQTFTNFELILVDDGSTDKCCDICDAYAEQDCRVVVVHQRNEGAAAARNSGLDAMRGRYVAFIDSDDYIDKDYIALLYNAICETKSDISICNWYMFDEINKESLIEHCYTKKNTTITGKELSQRRYADGIVVSPWGKLIHKDLFSSLRFPKGTACEDQAVVPKLYYYAKKACLIKEFLYYYRVRNNSISHERFAEKYYDNILHMNEHIKFLQQKQEKELYKLAVNLRDKVLAQYTISAKVNNIRNVPPGCEMGIIKALNILRKTCDNDTFTWNLAKIFPYAVRPYEYFRKIESILTGKPL